METHIEVHGIQLPIVDRNPPYKVAHPHEDGDGKCDKCAIVRHPITGEIFLVWCCGGINWSVSRENPKPREYYLKLLEKIPLDKRTTIH
jgi:hypothetical protein